MSGNIPVTTTVFESGLQSKINAVDSSTPIEDIIALVRAGELIDTIDNSAIATELQLRLDAVDGNTTPEQYIELAAAYGKVANEIKDIVSNQTPSGGGGAYGLTAFVTDIIPSGVTGELLIINAESAPTGSYVKLTTLASNNNSTSQAGISLISDGYTVFDEVTLSNYTIKAGDCYISYSVAASILASRFGLASAVGRSISINKNTGNTTQGIIYAYEIWSPLI